MTPAEVKVLGLTRDPAHIPTLTDALRSDDPAVRVMAAKALGWLRNPALADALCAAARDPHAEVRQAAVASLAVVGHAPCWRALAATLTTEPEAAVRSTTARVLGYLRCPATDALRGAMDDPDPETRSEAARALGRIGAVGAVPQLIAALDDAYPPVRTAAAAALGALDAGAVRARLASLVTDDPDAETRVVAARALARLTR